MTRPVMSLADRQRVPSAGNDFALRELMAVREIAHAFLMADRAQEVYQLALDRVSPLVGATFACVYLIDEGTDVMRLGAVHNWPARWAEYLGQMRVRLGAGPSGKAASERRVVEVLDVEGDPAAGDWREVAHELGFRSFVALPLQTGQGTLGAVTFYFASPNSIGPETRQLMRIVADQMAATAEKTRLIEGLQRANRSLVASNAALERQYADIVEARRIKDEFLANVSHELRTPLTAVVGYISLMQEGLAGPITTEQHRTLDQVREASDRLLTLIGDLLDLTALKRGDGAVVLGEFDPRDPLRDAIGMTTNRRAGVAFGVTQPEIVPMMESDRPTIARILHILLDNAFKFTKAGWVQATLTIDEETVRYAIADSGIGIPERARELVFEEFRQVDGTKTREFGGSGLGLALARRLARLVNGNITLASAPGNGSTFTVVLPLRARQQRVGEDS